MVGLTDNDGRRDGRGGDRRTPEQLEAAAARLAAMRELRAGGARYREVGAAFGISTERARVLLTAGEEKTE